MYDRTLQEKCLEIRQTGIGSNGQPVLFNRKTKIQGAPKKKPQAVKVDHAPLLDALKSLGLQPTERAVADAITALFPAGYADLDQGDVIRKVFLFLQSHK